MASASTKTLLLVIITILLPPLGVFMERGVGREFWISLVLTLFFFVPGLLYSLYVVLN